MTASSHRPRVALLVTICYLALAIGLPFLHRHGEPELAACTAVHRTALAHGAGSGEDHCPACQWDQIVKAAPPTPLLWTRSERLVTRFPLPRAEAPFFPAFGLPASRAPPSPSV